MVELGQRLECNRLEGCCNNPIYTSTKDNAPMMSRGVERVPRRGTRLARPVPTLHKMLGICNTLRPFPCSPPLAFSFTRALGNGRRVCRKLTLLG